jgi:hypothetical protein
MKGDCRIPFGIEDRRPEHSILDLLAPLVREIRIDDSQLTRFDLELDRGLFRLADRSARDGRSNDMAISDDASQPLLSTWMVIVELSRSISRPWTIA